ncbi:phosphoribosylaminoimidazolesuccinocarboxamide synthase [Miniphocaeibacter massiliensis]|uniref:phosphoribosylaminoimidazolesuccinocarboxamide synthase n=1 Tax=Miniphocaeibacter massiliensis TaxID=2041841 RepID=UPI000C1BCA8E|nr:phosphoribosylaminoimidazolesuccinocarboxamide synthase [Miniphocaeibacter massiliensis]
MELIYKGKTKDVYKNDEGNIVMKFKDDVTGVDGVFDPGANQVALTIEGVGKEDLRVSKFFFEKLNEKNIPTHYISSNVEENAMTVREAKVFGKGLEVICRYKAVGSFIRRYGLYAKEGMDLPGYVEITLKDDERNDPLITKDALIILDIINEKEYEEIIQLTKAISEVIREELAEKDLTLFDIKLEFGKLDNGEIVLIDELSGGNMRVYKNETYIEPMKIGEFLF